MRKSITQDMAYRQSLMNYVEKYGVTRASRKYNKNRSYITSVAKDRKAPSGGKSRTREADDAAIFA